jgi:hypothetical protein
MVSQARGGVLRIHRGYINAPDAVLRAVIRFLAPRTPRAARLAARAELLAFPVEQYAPSPPRRSEPLRRGDRRLLAELRQLHRQLNAEYFHGLLSAAPIRLSARMRTRLGEVRLLQDRGHPVEIALSRRHLARDPWPEVRETLLHEMIHQWQAESGRPVDHGPAFRRKARQVGVEPRAVRGEQGGMGTS